MADTTEVIYADRDRCCDDRNRGYGAGWGAVGGALGNNRIMDRLCQMERSQADCCCETKGLIRDMKNELALQAERNFCAITKNQEAIMCLIKDQAKDQEIARLTRELKFKDDSLLNFKLDAILKKEYGSTAAAAANL